MQAAALAPPAPDGTAAGTAAPGGTPPDNSASADTAPAGTAPADTAPADTALNEAALPGGTVALAIARAVLPEGESGTAIIVPADRNTGLAAFRRGDAAVIVFDQRRPLDVAAINADPVFAAATVQLLPTATVLRFTLPHGVELRPTRVAEGWRLWTGATPPPLRPVGVAVAGSEMILSANTPGRVVVVPDPQTGHNLLVGTQTGVAPTPAPPPPRPMATAPAAEAGGEGHATEPPAAPQPATQPTATQPTATQPTATQPTATEAGAAMPTAGQGVAAPRTTPEFLLLATWQGVAIEPLSDRPELRIGGPGFIIGASGGTNDLALSPPTASGAAVADAAAFTRIFDFPDMSTDMLLQRLHSAVAGAAAEPRMARLKLRIAAAETMIALGLGAEAQAVLQVAAQDDPRATADPQVGGLAAVAALLAGRLSEAAGIADPALGNSDEINLWRAVRQALLQEGDPAAAAELAATVPLALAYPEAIQARLLPLMAETMVLGGQQAAAATLLAKRPNDASLALARAMLLQAQGDTGGALAAYDTLTRGNDQLTRARAGSRAIELRLATGAMKPGEAAQALEHMLYGWRGDEREKQLRLRIAALRAQAGQWRQSLAFLRESDALFAPDDTRFKAALHDTFAKLLAGNTADQLSPFDLVEVVENNADLMPEGPAGEAMVARLADRLDALDLPRRSEAVLDKLMHTAGSAAARGQFAVQLARLRLANNDPAGALAALSATTDDGLSPALLERRTLLAARATAALGRAQDAITLLVPLTTPAADEARASIDEHVPDWPAAEAAMASYVAATVPAAGTLDAAQTAAVLRLAGDAAQAGDDAGLARLRTDFAPRIADKAATEMLRALTEVPVRGLADLARSGRETAALRALPGALQAMGAPIPASASAGAPRPAAGAAGARNAPPGSAVP